MEKGIGYQLSNSRIVQREIYLWKSVIVASYLTADPGYKQCKTKPMYPCDTTHEPQTDNNPEYIAWFLNDGAIVAGLRAEEFDKLHQVC